ncbi:MAG: 50S ribosomal protein L1 [Thaumarchaeota archaeon]|jgi:large subunit ribosomal protein L1|nr:50S ribosomal protein L1 [Nitrososphaerota archaeon]
MSVALSVSKSSLENALRKALSPENNRPRKFRQSVEIVVCLAGVDLSKPDQRFTELVELPHSPYKSQPKICVFTDGSLTIEAKSLGLDVLSRDSLSSMAGKKKNCRKIAQSYDFFIAEAPLMPLVGRVLGQFLGPKNKMPTPVPPASSITPIVERLRRSVRLVLKSSLAVSCKIGHEEMTVQQLLENASAVLSVVERRLPRSASIRYVGFKTTMGRIVKASREAKA